MLSSWLQCNTHINWLTSPLISCSPISLCSVNLDLACLLQSNGAQRATMMTVFLIYRVTVLDLTGPVHIFMTIRGIFIFANLSCTAWYCQGSFHWNYFSILPSIHPSIHPSIQRPFRFYILRVVYSQVKKVTLRGNFNPIALRSFNVFLEELRGVFHTNCYHAQKTWGIEENISCFISYQEKQELPLPSINRQPGTMRLFLFKESR